MKSLFSDCIVSIIYSCNTSQNILVMKFLMMAVVGHGHKLAISHVKQSSQEIDDDWFHDLRWRLDYDVWSNPPISLTSACYS